MPLQKNKSFYFRFVFLEDTHEFARAFARICSNDCVHDYSSK
jgi:hypothetical protein